MPAILNTWRRALLALSLGLMLTMPAAALAGPMVLIHPPPENVGDLRHVYYWDVLEAAMKATRPSWGDYRIETFPVPMNFRRAAAEVAAGDAGKINIVARATNSDLERRLLSIPLPLDKGLLGYRVFLVMPSVQARLDKEVRTLDDLRRFTIGQNTAWTDVRILENNLFKVITTDSYDGLFPMLGAGRFDLLARGVFEVLPEWNAYRGAVPGMAIERNLILSYPMARFFFVPRTEQGARMAKRITEGLLLMQKSGEFDRLYRGYKAALLDELNLSGRKVFRLENPEFSRQAPPLDDPFWWDHLTPELAPPVERAPR